MIISIRIIIAENSGTAAYYAHNCGSATQVGRVDE